MKRPIRFLKGEISFFTLVRHVMIFLLISGSFEAFASTSYSDKARFTMNYESKTVMDVISEIERQSEFSIFYKDDEIDIDRVVNVSVRNSKVFEILDQVFTGSEVEYQVVDKVIVLTKKVKQEFTVSGKVTDAMSEEPLPGVNVLEKGTTNGTITDENGDYSLTISDPNASLVFSYIGYLQEDISVAGQSTINLSLIEDIQKLDEVVVIGYGTVKKSDLTGAVASVSTEDLNKIPTPTVGKALQGKASGVMVLQSGEPGGDVNIRVRGIGSLNRDPDPLYVIDGVVDADINTIAPEDIETLQVLKDASATAIYGADGANGVVIITTKRGEPGKTRVSFSSYVGINQVPKQFDLMNADQYAALYDSLLTWNNQTPPMSYSDEFRQFYYGDGWEEGTNWQDEITQQSITQNYYMNISGGGENSNYSVSGRYYTETGTLRGTAAERFNLRINSDFKLGKYFRIGETVNFSRRVDQDANEEAWRNSLESSPLMRVYNENNKEGFEGAQIPFEYPVADSTIGVLNTGGNDKFNPRGQVEIPEDFKYRNNLQANIYVEFKPFSWLEFRSEPHIGINTTRDHEWTPAYDMGVRSVSAASLEHNMREGVGTAIENKLTVNQSFGGHNFNVIAVHHARKGYSNNVDVTATGFPYEQLNVISQSSIDGRVAGGRYNPWAKLSYLGRVMYDYNSNILFTASIRRDGTSNFGEDNRWGTFPSFSGAVKINEYLFPSFTAVSMLKLRAGWGKTGNSDIGSFRYQDLIADPSDFHIVIGNERVAALNELRQIGNPLVKWEAAEMLNFGADANLFRGRLQASAEYFVKKQNDLLAQIVISRALGRVDAEPWMNVGKIKNEGFEFDVRYSQMEGSFNYNIAANFSKVKNKVISVPEAFIRDHNITDEGHTIGSLYGWIAERVVQEDDFDEDGKYMYASQSGVAPGDIKFKDLNRDGSIDDLDRTIIGKPVPDFTYSLNIETFYQNFDLSVFLFGMQNFDVYNQQRSKIESFETQDMAHNKSAEYAENYYRPWAPTDEWLRADINNTNDNTRISTWWVEDASFLRIQDLQLGYTLPMETLNRLNISNARIYVSAKNLYTVTGYKGRDPEAPINTTETGVNNNPLEVGVDDEAYPIPRSFTLGVQLDF